LNTEHKLRQQACVDAIASYVHKQLTALQRPDPAHAPTKSVHVRDSAHLPTDYAKTHLDFLTMQFLQNATAKK
jgi:hypothetical protein